MNPPTVPSVDLFPAVLADCCLLTLLHFVNGNPAPPTECRPPHPVGRREPERGGRYPPAVSSSRLYRRHYDTAGQYVHKNTRHHIWCRVFFIYDIFRRRKSGKRDIPVPSPSREPTDAETSSATSTTAGRRDFSPHLIVPTNRR